MTLRYVAWVPGAARTPFLAAVAVLVLVLVGCGGDASDELSAEPENTPAPTTGPTSTPAPTATPSPMPTPTPTPWSIDPEVSAKLPAGWTAEVEMGPLPGSSSEPPSGGTTGAVDDSGSRWKYRGVLGRLKPKEAVVEPATKRPSPVAGAAPLTGLPPAVPEDRPAVVVKIDNVDAARPQTAINQADIVYEELVEAGHTRLAAVFHSELPDAVGPVRSARSTDIGIVDSFNRPVFVFSGANSIFEKLVDKQPIYNRGAEVADGYWRGGSRPAPHNLYASAAGMASTAEEPEAPRPHFAYRDEGEELHPTAVPASVIRLRYEDERGALIEYRWSPEAAAWQRWQGGTAHTDVNGEQIMPENVVVQFVEYIDAGLTDKFDEDLFEGVSVGTGPAMIFTAGHVIEATWTRPNLRSMATYTDGDGAHIELTPGQTYVSLVSTPGMSWE